MTAIAESHDEIAQPSVKPAVGLGLILATVGMLVRRDLVRFFRQKSRVLGALAQPLIFWVIIGSGLGGTFSLGRIGYLEYFYPGVVVMVVLFTSIFSTMSVIEDRHGGFLQAVLVAPAPRIALVLGKTLGGVAVALLQAGILLALAPLAGFHVGAASWPLAITLLVLLSIALCALGFAIAWWLDSTQGYHAVMSVILIPAWILSGAMFPVEKTASWMAPVMRANPVTYGVEGLRRALYGGTLPAGAGLGGSSAVIELLVVAAFAVVCVALAARLAARKQ